MQKVLLAYRFGGWSGPSAPLFSPPIFAGGDKQCICILGGAVCPVGCW